MEVFLIYIVKSTGLVVLFYSVYYFLLRKETFFNSNRWFLLAGLITSVVLPFIFYTKNIWVDPTPLPDLNFSQVHISDTTEKKLDINWNYIIFSIYGIGFLVFLTKFVIDFHSLYLVLKDKKIQKQADYKFIDLKENIAPFSYFDYIVYNSSMYTASELTNIIEHEKVHSDQNHTSDVLITRIFCLLFWFNPFIWLYKKAITQNLEFIADSEVAKKISDKKAYQYTLLKITTHETCVAITNHFYQSLIKKRIVMLNKNQSKKQNSWKYYVVIPALVAFVLLFQVEVIAHEKAPVQYLKIDNGSVDIFKITKTTTDEELKEKTKTLKENYDISAIFSNVERNSNNEIISINVDLKKTTEISQKMNLKGTKAIKPFGIIISKLENGKLNVGFKTEDSAITNENVKAFASATALNEKEIFINGEKATEDELNALDPNDIESMDVIKNSEKPVIKITTKHLTKPIKITDKEIYINGVKSDSKEFSELDKNTIDDVNINTTENTVRITTKTVKNSANNVSVKVNSNVGVSVDQQQKPIIIINGVQANSQVTVDDIPSNDIVSVNVIKGKSAEDKYGNAGKNGAVEIITKNSTEKNEQPATIKIQKKPGNQFVTTSYKLKTENAEKPLIVIDGKIIENKNIEDLDSQNIQKMDVLKGISAVTKYGDKGKNGVIEITTKK